MALDNRFNTADLKAARAKFPSKKNGGLDWHNALKSQAVGSENIRRERLPHHRHLK